MAGAGYQRLDDGSEELGQDCERDPLGDDCDGPEEAGP